MIYVFVDFEMNMIDSEYKKEKKICKSEIIEIGAVKLDVVSLFLWISAI